MEDMPALFFLSWFYKAEEGLLLLRRLLPGAELGFWEPDPNIIHKWDMKLTSFN